MKLSRLLPVFGVILFVYIILNSHPTKLLQAVSGINPFYMAVALPFSAVILCMKGLKWRMIMRISGIDYPLKSSIRVWSIGMFAGIVTPGRIGDLIRAFYLNKQHKSFGRCVSTVIIDRIIDISIIFVFAIAGILLFSGMLGHSVYMEVMLFFMVAYFIVLYAAAKKNLTGFMLRPIYGFFFSGKHRKKLSAGFNDFYDTVAMMRKNMAGTLLVCALTLLIWAVSVFQIQLVALSLGIKLDYFFLLAIMSMAVMIELVPVSVSGMGTRDAFFIFALGNIGIVREYAVVFSIFYLFIYWLTAAVGLVFWFREPVKIKI